MKYCGSIGLVVFVLVASNAGLAGDKDGPGRAKLAEIKKEILAIDGSRYSKGAGGEIAVAQKWLAAAEAYVDRGDTTRAALLIERLSSQLVLLRYLCEAHRIQMEIEKWAKRVHGVQTELETLHLKLERLVLERRGAELTSTTSSTDRSAAKGDQ